MKICFWGNIAGALKGNTAGGGELQLAMVAKALARSGSEVVVVDYESDEDFVTEDGIKVYRIKEWNKGIRVLRTFTHRLPGLYRSLKAQKADIYYCRIRDFRHIISYWAAKSVKAKFVLGLASDLDAMNFKMRLKYNHLVSKGGLWAFSNGLLIEMVYPFLLKNADLVLAQHEGQREILAQKGIKSVVFPNLFQKPAGNASNQKEKKDFVYVGWLDKRKGFVKMFELIKMAPQHTFTIVGPPSDKTGQNIFDELKKYPNVKLMGKLSHKDTVSCIANAKALISTSAMEGFPNIFVEAWANGIPVLSLFVDPGRVIEGGHLGKMAHGDLNTLASFLNETQNCEEFSVRAKRYVEDYHELNSKKITETEELFSGILN